MSEDTHRNSGDAPFYPARNGFVITPDDNNDLPFVPKSIWVGTGGTLWVIMIDDQTNTPIDYQNVPSGTWMDLRVKRVMEATDADGLRGVV